LIVHCGGLDELAAIGVAETIEITKDGKRTAKKMDPLPLCSKYYTIADLKGGDAAHNAKILRTLLGGGGGDDLRACFDTVALNAGAVLLVSDIAKSMEEGFAMASEAMRSGSALKKLDELAMVAQDLKSKRAKVGA